MRTFASSNLADCAKNNFIPHHSTRSVIFDCPSAHALFDENSAIGIGGAEVRAVTFAEGLSRRTNWDIQFILSNSTDREATSHGPITIHYEYDRQKSHWMRNHWRRMGSRLVDSWEQRCFGVPPYRRQFPRTTADVVLTFGVSNRVASVVRTAHQRGQRVLVFLTSDRTLDDVQRTGRQSRGLYGEIGSLCRYALLKADAVVAQTHFQREQLQSRLGILASVIRNPIDLEHSQETSRTRPQEADTPYVLWVGRADINSKRADLALEVARMCPRRRFVMIMNRHDELIFEQICRACPDNVTIVPHVPWGKIESYFAHAQWLMNTSNQEGLPNAFLQAGKYGVPILSLNADPDAMLARGGCGLAAKGQLSDLAKWLNEIESGSDRYLELSRSIRQHVRDYHDLHARCDELESILDRLVDEGCRVTFAPSVVETAALQEKNERRGGRA